MSIGLKTVVNKGSWLVRTLATEQRCRRSRQAAMRDYQKVIQRGCRPVDEPTRKRIEDYANERFGSAKYSPWLFVYTAHCGEFREGWIPEDYLFFKILPVINPPAIANVSMAKTLTSSLFGTAPSPDLVSRVDGSWISKAGEVLTQEQARAHAFRATDRVYVKADNKNQGYGIRIADKDEFNQVCKQWTTDFVVQFPVEQHVDLSRFHAGSVATLRILTYKRHACSPAVLSAHLRFARGDWRYVSSRGNSIRVAIDRDTGTLAEKGVDESWSVHSVHPDSGVAFQSFQCPGFRRAVDLCEQLHLRIPQLAFIGWDIAIDGHGEVWLLEWGALTPGFTFPETAVGPLFADLDVAKLRTGPLPAD